MTERPRDECPYPKPFPTGFSACPAFQETQFVPLDTQYRPLNMIPTCANLDMGRITGSPWRHFGRCRIGDEQRRLAWVGAVRADRLAVARALQREMAPMMAGEVAELWALKGRQLSTAAGTEEHSTATAELMRRGTQFLSLMEKYLEEHSDAMGRLKLPIGATMELFREIVYSWVDQPNAEIPTISEASLSRFPEEARVLLMPETAA